MTDCHECLTLAAEPEFARAMTDMEAATEFLVRYHEYGHPPAERRHVLREGKGDTQ